MMDEWFCKIVCLHKKEKQKILSVVDCGSSTGRVITKTIKYIYCFSAKHAISRSKRGDWLVRNNDNVLERSDISIRELLLP